MYEAACAGSCPAGSGDICHAAWTEKHAPGGCASLAESRSAKGCQCCCLPRAVPDPTPGGADGISMLLRLQAGERYAAQLQQRCPHLPAPELRQGVEPCAPAAATAGAPGQQQGPSTAAAAAGSASVPASEVPGSAAHQPPAKFLPTRPKFQAEHAAPSAAAAASAPAGMAGPLPAAMPPALPKFKPTASEGPSSAASSLASGPYTLPAGQPPAKGKAPALHPMAAFNPGSAAPAPTPASAPDGCSSCAAAAEPAAPPAAAKPSSTLQHTAGSLQPACPASAPAFQQQAMLAQLQRVQSPGGSPDGRAATRSGSMELSPLLGLGLELGPGQEEGGSAAGADHCQAQGLGGIAGGVDPGAAEEREVLMLQQAGGGIKRRQQAQLQHGDGLLKRPLLVADDEGVAGAGGSGGEAAGAAEALPGDVR